MIAKRMSVNLTAEQELQLKALAILHKMNLPDVVGKLIEDAAAGGGEEFQEIHQGMPRPDIVESWQGPKNNPEFIRALIGSNAITLLARAAIYGYSVRRLADDFGMPKSSIHDELGRAKKKLEAHGLWPIIDKGLIPASPAAAGAVADESVAA